MIVLIWELSIEWYQILDILVEQLPIESNLCDFFTNKSKIPLLAYFDEFWLQKSPKFTKRTPEVNIVIILNRKYQISHLYDAYIYSRDMTLKNYVNLSDFSVG